MTVELIRHGVTALQERRCYQGATDEPLSPLGRAALKPADFVPGVLCVSPLRRTQETAELLFPRVQQIIVPDLAEMNFGAFEARSYLDMEHDAAYRAWVESGCLSRCPGGEAKAEFCDRVCAAFLYVLELARVRQATTLVIVGHGGTQMAIMERFCTELRPYYEWQTKSGCGIRLQVAETACTESPSLTPLEWTDYNR